MPELLQRYEGSISTGVVVLAAHGCEGHERTNLIKKSEQREWCEGSAHHFPLNGPTWEVVRGVHHATTLISTISLEHNQPHLHTLTMSTPSGHARPIIIVTGANKYVACPLSTRLPTPALTVLPLGARAQRHRLRDLSPPPARRPAKQPRRRPPALSARGRGRAGRRVPLRGPDARHGVSQPAARGGGAREAARDVRGRRRAVLFGEEGVQEGRWWGCRAPR